MSVGQTIQVLFFLPPEHEPNNALHQIIHVLLLAEGQPLFGNEASKLFQNLRRHTRRQACTSRRGLCVRSVPGMGCRVVAGGRF